MICQPGEFFQDRWNDIGNKLVAMAKFLQASLIVIGILAAARLCGRDFASLYNLYNLPPVGLSQTF
jgi:hypothetical protein